MKQQTEEHLQPENEVWKVLKLLGLVWNSTQRASKREGQATSVLIIIRNIFMSISITNNSNLRTTRSYYHILTALSHQFMRL
jgi:hypothetical protein